MADFIEYNGRKYFKHPKQKYYYVGRKGNNYSRTLHRQMWYDAHGEIPKGMQVHHINHDSFDNRIENFELVERSKHISAHMIKRHKENPEYSKEFKRKGIEAAPKWHASKEGIEWHRQNAINNNFGHQTYGEANCDECGSVFIKRNARARFCHQNCKSRWRNKNNPTLIEIHCPVCLVKFTTVKYNERKYCSRKCQPSPNPYGMNGKPLII